MPINTRTTTKATHRTLFKYEPDFGERQDKASKGRKWIDEAYDVVLKCGNPGRLIIECGIGGGVSSVAFEETQVVPQSDIIQ